MRRHVLLKVNVSHGKDAGSQGDLMLPEAAGVTSPIIALMMVLNDGQCSIEEAKEAQHIHRPCGMELDLRPLAGG